MSNLRPPPSRPELVTQYQHLRRQLETVQDQIIEELKNWCAAQTLTAVASTLHISRAYLSNVCHKKRPLSPGLVDRLRPFWIKSR